MKSFLALLFLTGFIVACSTQQSNNKNVDVEEINPKLLIGQFATDFSGGELLLYITDVVSDSIYGYDIHKELKRDLTGTYHISGDTLFTDLFEPGNHEYDGVFHLHYINKVGENFKGHWSLQSDPSIAESVNFRRKQ